MHIQTHRAEAPTSFERFYAYFACVALVLSLFEYCVWLKTGGGLLESLWRGRERWVVNPFVSMCLFFVGLVGFGLDRLVREHVLAPRPEWFVSREAVMRIRVAAAFQSVIFLWLVFEVIYKLAAADDCVFSPSFALLGMPLGIGVNGLWLRFVSRNEVRIVSL